jgi:bacillithiol biosynthesis deacetylase BshB1
MKLDILVLASHPDDAELGCSGTIAAHIQKGYKVGIIDMTRGELGTRGSVADRKKESENSARILGLSVRENLELEDGFFSEGPDECHAVLKAIRKYRPEIIFANAPEDRHPDHGRGGRLAIKAGFLSGLAKIETYVENIKQEPWRARHIFHYIQDKYLHPDFVVDISGFWEIKEACIMAFKTQFYDPESIEPLTYISDPDFMPFVRARARELGHSIGVSYGEGFLKSKQIGLENLLDIR